MLTDFHRDFKLDVRSVFDRLMHCHSEHNLMKFGVSRRDRVL